MAVGEAFGDVFETLEIDDPNGAFFTFVNGMADLVKFMAQLVRLSGQVGDFLGVGETRDWDFTARAAEWVRGQLFGPSSTNSAPNRVGAQTVINVNGTVLDPEGTARAINRVLTQSQRRAGAY